MEKTVKYPDLQPLTKGSSFKHVFDFLYKAAQLRYTNYEILNKVSNKLGTPKKLSKFVELGYLVRNKGDIFTVSEQSLRVLEAEGYSCKILKPAQGEGNEHNLKVAEAVLSFNYYAVLYPHFGDLIPDACVIETREREYKITFLEIEQEKDGWRGYLEAKKEKYDKLARDVDIYEKWWKVWSEKLGLPFCKMENFCFGVSCFGNIKRDWEGWNWQTLN